MASPLSKNLDRLMAEAHLSAEELGRRLALPASTIKKIRTDQHANPTLTTLAPIAKYFLLSISELIGEEPISTARLKGSYQFPASKLQRIPIIPWHDIQEWPATKSKTAKYVTSEYSYSKNAFALVIEDAGWENLSLGTTLIVDPDIQADHHDFVIVLRDHMKPTMKQLLIDDDISYLKSVVPGYKLTIKNEKHLIAGVVMEYKKQLRR